MQGAQSLADSIESALVADRSEPLHLEGGAADATYCVLRLMVGLDNEGAAAAGLRDALGTPVPTEPAPRPPRTGATLRQLSRPEMVELLIILFVLAVLTVVLGIAWTGTWWVLAPVIAALIGLRVATTRTSGALRLVGRLRGLVRECCSCPRRCSSRSSGCSSPRSSTADGTPRGG